MKESEIRRGSVKVAVPPLVSTPPIVRLPAEPSAVATEIPSLSAGVVNDPWLRYCAMLSAPGHVPDSPLKISPYAMLN